MIHSPELWMNVGNALICFMSGWACICRLAAMNIETKRSVRAYYTLALGAIAASAFTAPIFGDRVSWGQIIMSTLVLLSFVVSFDRWKRGVPEDATRPAELHDSGHPA